MVSEDGLNAAMQYFHANLPLKAMPCTILPNSPASWTYKKAVPILRMSKIAARILVENGIIASSDVTNHETYPIIITNNRWDPVTRPKLSSSTHRHWHGHLRIKHHRRPFRRADAPRC
jgi:hypothetical protein